MSHVVVVCLVLCVAIARGILSCLCLSCCPQALISIISVPFTLTHYPLTQATFGRAHTLSPLVRQHWPSLCPASGAAGDVAHGVMHVTLVLWTTAILTAFLVAQKGERKGSSFVGVFFRKVRLGGRHCSALGPMWPLWANFPLVRCRQVH